MNNWWTLEVHRIWSMYLTNTNWKSNVCLSYQKNTMQYLRYPYIEISQCFLSRRRFVGVFVSFVLVCFVFCKIVNYVNTPCQHSNLGDIENKRVLRLCSLSHRWPWGSGFNGTKTNTCGRLPFIANPIITDESLNFSEDLYEHLNF